MPASNPFAPVIEVGGGATVGPASGNASVSVGDHHAAAGMVLIGLAILVLLWKGKFRFSTTVS
jgi:hypothetical protein